MKTIQCSRLEGDWSLAGDSWEKGHVQATDDSLLTKQKFTEKVSNKDADSIAIHWKFGGLKSIYQDAFTRGFLVDINHQILSDCLAVRRTVYSPDSLASAAYPVKVQHLSRVW